MKRITTLVIFAVVSLLPFVGEAQKKNSAATRADGTTGNDVRIKNGEPHLSLSFIEVKELGPEKNGETGYRVFVQLNNNSKWKIFICGGSVSSPEYGSFDVMFEVERVSGSGPVPKSWWSDACSLNTIREGASSLLSIPIEYLADGLAIRIRYRYQWEFEKSGFLNPNGPRHFLYFSSLEIPAEKIPAAFSRRP